MHRRWQDSQDPRSNKPPVLVFTRRATNVLCSLDSGGYTRSSEYECRQRPGSTSPTDRFLLFVPLLLLLLLFQFKYVWFATGLLERAS